MNKLKSKIAIFFSVVYMPFIFSCDFRSKEDKPPMDEDNTCVVTWQNKDGTILNQEVYERGDYPSYKLEDPQFEDKSGDFYRFSGWDPDIEQVYENTTFTATYDKVEGSKFAYRLDSSGEFYRLIKFSPSETETSVTIESTYNDKPVKVIDNYALKGCKSIKSITLSNGLEEIADCAFQNTSISEIVIPDTVKKIGINIFKDCKNLTKVTFPTGIETIPERTFYNCDNLTTVNIPDTVKTISAKAFYNCSYLNTVNISNSVEVIENKAFYQCEKLKTVNIDTVSCSLNVIAGYAFSETDITNFSLPNKIDTIAEYSFANCSNLQSFTIPTSMTGDVRIKESAFEGCSKLSSFNVPNNNVTSIEKRAFRDCKSLSSFTLSPNISIIEDSAFQNCQSLVNLNISDLQSLIKIGDKAFYNTAFTSIKIPQNVNYFGDKAFGNCANLKNVIFPGEKITFKTGMSNTFSNCPNYTSNYIDPEKTDLVGTMFTSSTSRTLTNLSIPNNINSISSDALNNCTSLIYNDYPTDSSNGYVCHYLGNSTNPYLALAKVDISNNDSIVQIHKDCKVIADNAFQNISKPFSVTIDGYLRNLGNLTFNNSAIKNITFTPNASLSEIKPNVFANSQLESITLPKDISGVSGLTFKGCAKLATINLNSDNLSNYKTFDNKILVEDGTLIAGIKNYDFANKELNDEIKVIGSYAFSDRYKLSYLNIPSSVETIKEYAFSGCTTLTKTIFGIDEKESQLKEIEKNAFSDIDVRSSTREIRYKNTLQNWLNIEFGSKSAIPNSLENTAYYFTQGNSLAFKEITPSETIRTIKKFYPYVLAGSKTVTYLEIDYSQLTEIGEYAFYGATNLEDIFFKQYIFYEGDIQPIKINKIGEYAFFNCYSLEKFTQLIPSPSDTTSSTPTKICRLDDLTSIGTSAFENCSSLETSFWFKNIQKLAPNAFAGAVEMTKMYFEITNDITLGYSDRISFEGFSTLENLFFFYRNTGNRVTIASNCFSTVSGKVSLLLAYATSIKNDFTTEFYITPINAFLLTNYNSNKSEKYAFASSKNPPNYNYWYNESGGVIKKVKVD